MPVAWPQVSAASVPTESTTKSASPNHHGPTCDRPHASATAVSVPECPGATGTKPAPNEVATSVAHNGGRRRAGDGGESLADTDTSASCHFFAFFATDAYTILHVGFDSAQAAAPHRLVL